MLTGALLVPAVAFGAVVAAFLLAFARDLVCLAISILAGLVGAVFVGETRIAYLPAFLHGVLTVLCFFVGTGVAATAVFLCASLAARRIGRKSFLNSDDDSAFGPAALTESAWVDNVDLPLAEPP